MPTPPPAPVCRVCGTPILRLGRGRPRATCSPVCARTDDADRKRSDRSIARVDRDVDLDARPPRDTARAVADAEHALKALAPVERLVVRIAYGFFDDGEPAFDDEVAERLTTEHPDLGAYDEAGIRRLRKEALAKMRAALAVGPARVPTVLAADDPLDAPLAGLVRSRDTGRARVAGEFDVLISEAQAPREDGATPPPPPLVYPLVLRGGTQWPDTDAAADDSDLAARWLASPEGIERFNAYPGELAPFAHHARPLAKPDPATVARLRRALRELPPLTPASRAASGLSTK